MEIVLTGLARDCESGLTRSARFIRELASSVDLRCVFATNDNTDNTGKVLEDWSRQNEGVRVLELPSLKDRFSRRTERLALLRNATMREARSMASPGTTHLIVLDMDGLNEHVSVASVLAAMQSMSSQGWHGAFANQRTAYYDLYALRKHRWVEGDVFKEADMAASKASQLANRTPMRQVNNLAGGMLGKWLYKKVWQRLVYGRQYLVSPNLENFAVESAFGGLGVYDWRACRDLVYDGLTADDDMVCEHVSFNRALRAKGGRLCIAPSLLNDAPSEHLGEGSGKRAPRYITA